MLEWRNKMIFVVNAEYGDGYEVYGGGTYYAGTDPWKADSVAREITTVKNKDLRWCELEIWRDGECIKSFEFTP
jgi:hypothetical protein